MSDRTLPPEALDAWADALREKFDLAPEDVPITQILDLARDVATGVARPAAPFSAFVAGLVAGRLAEVETLRVHHGMFDPNMTRGSMLSFGHIAASPPLAWRHGEWQDTDAGARGTTDFPGDGELPTWAIPGPELISIQCHVTARTIDATMNIDVAAGALNLTDEVIAAEALRPRQPIHLPSPSYWPVLVALMLPVIAFGVIFFVPAAIAGVAGVVVCLFGWALEPSVEPPPR